MPPIEPVAAPHPALPIAKSNGQRGLSVRTACPYCGVGCGVLATRQADQTVQIAGDPDHPSNFGRLCSKGSALGETLALDDRLLHPLIDGARASWETALDLVATRFKATIAEHGPDSVAFYVSGQILTEDYYVANKLMKGFIGSANIDTNSRLCMASSVAGHKRAFGTDTVPGCYEDLDEADLVVLVGSNLAWCHPVLYQRLAAARAERGTKVVVIDPRATATCEIADLHLALAPGTDVALFDGLLNHIAGANAINRDYVSRYTSGIDAALASARQLSARAISRATGISRLDLFRFYDLFVSTARVVTVYSQGVNQATSGTDKVNAIINCHLATGRIGRPGMGPFSVTGQPNAMGGRETGGLANMLAAHMELDNPRHRDTVQTFWGAPAIASKPGLKAVDMFRAVGCGRIKAIWIMATNPVDSMPDADSVRDALARCPFVVVSDVTRHTDTILACRSGAGPNAGPLGRVLLPSLAWGEKSGTVTNSERRISRQRAFLPAPGEARADWWQMAEVGRRMGFAHAFTYAGPHEIFAEYARLTGTDNIGTRDLDIGAFGGIGAADYDTLAPFQWPKAADQDQPKQRFFADGRFYTPDGRARFVPTPPRANPRNASSAYPLILNTGRIRDQWHTMTRTAKTARLMSHIAEPFIEIHPEDAGRCGITAASLVTVASAGRVGTPPDAQATIIVRARLTESQRPGSVFVPMHWTDQYASAGRVDGLIAGDVDPVSGQPGLKQMPVAVAPYAARWYGLAVSRARPAIIRSDSRVGYWALSPVKAGWRIELAGETVPDDFAVAMRGWLDLDDNVEMLAYHDARTGQHRFAAFEGDRLVAALFVAPQPVAASRSWAAEQLAQDSHAPAERFRVLAGRGGGAVPDRGSTVCACFEIGRNQIIEAVTSGGCRSVEAVGESLKAGTNCGSCRAEIGRIIHDARLAKAG